MMLSTSIVYRLYKGAKLFMMLFNLASFYKCSGLPFLTNFIKQPFKVLRITSIRIPFCNGQKRNFQIVLLSTQSKE